MSLKKLPWLVPQLLPASVRHALYRRLVKVDPSPHDSLTIKIAQTQQELEQAFKLLHDCYVKSGFMKPHPSGLRIPVYHALPSTSTIVALWDQQVVGTISIIRDNPLGLPLDRIFDVSEFRKKGQRVAEISALAIAPSFRGKRGQILFPLLKYLYQYCVGYFGVDHMLIAVNPKQGDFYKAILFFQALQGREVSHYDFVNGAPAVGLHLGMRYAYDRFEEKYRGTKRDLFEYFTKAKFSNLEFPERTYFKISDPIMTPQLLDYFFNQRTRLFSELGDWERTLLRLIYRRDPACLNILPHPSSPVQNPDRKHPRFDVRCPGTVRSGPDHTFRMLVGNASRSGFAAHLSREIRYGVALTFQVEVGYGEVSEIHAYPVWDNRAGTYGFSIEKADDTWQQFITYLESDLLRKKA